MAQNRRLKDSSVTRVQPVFRQLHHGDPTGITWLANLLSMGSRSGAVCPSPARQDGPGASSDLLSRFVPRLQRKNSGRRHRLITCVSG